jgi:hypothetical protein
MLRRSIMQSRSAQLVHVREISLDVVSVDMVAHLDVQLAEIGCALSHGNTS